MSTSGLGGGSSWAKHVPTAMVGCAGLVAALPSLYLAALSVAALRPAPGAPATPGSPAPRLVVLVPAHDEEILIGRCVGELLAQEYPRDRLRIVVVADNCTDDTAELARAHGAETLERHDPRHPGKGRALRWAMDALMATDPDLEAFVVVDADSITDPGMLRALAVAYSAGAQVAQADYEALVEGDDDRSQLRAAAFLLFHRVRFTGKARLGRPCGLVGNGMLFSREVCTRLPWSAYSEVEDLEYGVQLRLAGVGPTFVPDAHLVAPVASGGPAAAVQRRRWEGGRARVMREHLPRLARAMATEGRGDLWDLAADLAIPPIGVLGSVIVAGAATTVTLRAAGVVDDSATVPWVLAGTALGAHVVVGLTAADASPAMWRALRSAPRLVASELGTRLRATGGGEGDRWVRTPRTPVPSP